MKKNRAVSKLIAGSLGVLLAVCALPNNNIFSSIDASAEIINAYGSIEYNTDDRMYVYTLSDYVIKNITIINDTPCISFMDNAAPEYSAKQGELNITDADEECIKKLGSLTEGKSYDIVFESKVFYDFLNTSSVSSFDIIGNSMWEQFLNDGSSPGPFHVNPELGFDPFKDKDKNYDNFGFFGWSSALSLRADRLISVKRHNFHYYGDINGDEVIDSFDRLEYGQYINNCLGRELSADEFLNADINEDKRIDSEDYQQVTDFILGKESEFNSFKEIGSIRLDEKINIQRAEGKQADKKFADSQMKLGVDLLKECFDPESKEKNILISPFSISSSLSMMANGADNNTLKEMEEVLGGKQLSLDDINEYMSYFLSNLPDKDGEHLNVANSLWCKDADYFKPLDSFLETDRKYYNAEIYKTGFDNSTVTDINSWVNKNTNGMIPTAIRKEDLKDDVRIALINTLYFDMEWNKKYDNATNGIFTALDGTTHKIMEMSSNEDYYYELEDADAFKKPYLNGDYFFVGIMPRDKDIIRFVNDLDPEKLSDALTKPYQSLEVPLNLRVMIPEFEYSYATSLPKALQKLGMKEAFDELRADFSRLNDQTVDKAEPIYLGDVIHKTKIEISKEGTKAAAASISFGNAGGMSPKTKDVIIRLDKPFVYMIVDKNNIPMFIGAATELGT
ncbi:MAG: hypothetical protein K6G33_06545 [Ruminococcus sp.]|uniref:serpin family protein n=1 Tax=Ruminococcus sp. TaxID=41978 RepID=UPI0025DF993D|nr:serpin family protein [Ruminococcus sp.]MCR5600377.1 hypothetical protein [Ruminococcus sp.]